MEYKITLEDQFKIFLLGYPLFVFTKLCVNNIAIRTLQRRNSCSLFFKIVHKIIFKLNVSFIYLTRTSEAYILNTWFGEAVKFCFYVIRQCAVPDSMITNFQNKICEQFLWNEYIDRMENTRLVKRTRDWVPNGRRSRGRSKSRWKDNMTQDDWMDKSGCKLKAKRRTFFFK